MTVIESASTVFLKSPLNSLLNLTIVGSIRRRGLINIHARLMLALNTSQANTAKKIGKRIKKRGVMSSGNFMRKVSLTRSTTKNELIRPPTIFLGEKDAVIIIQNTKKEKKAIYSFQ